MGFKDVITMRMQAINAILGAVILSAVVGLLFLFNCGCNGGSRPMQVGAVHKSYSSPEDRKRDAWYGHNNTDITNPSLDEIEFYCSMCHIVY